MSDAPCDTGPICPPPISTTHNRACALIDLRIEHAITRDGGHLPQELRYGLLGIGQKERCALDSSVL